MLVGSSSPPIDESSVLVNICLVRNLYHLLETDMINNVGCSNRREDSRAVTPKTRLPTHLNQSAKRAQGDERRIGLLHLISCFMAPEISRTSTESVSPRLHSGGEPLLLSHFELTNVSIERRSQDELPNPKSVLLLTATRSFCSRKMVPSESSFPGISRSTIKD